MVIIDPVSRKHELSQLRDVGTKSGLHLFLAVFLHGIRSGREGVVGETEQ